ncbi:oligosaccharide flippase family protein [Roseibium sp. SCP14]|uniref:oligosaccharide flippase family protein n=1 Tax=Roseibium sp. SCP14 TaxID=3141375 RepID=UPI003337D608
MLRHVSSYMIANLVAAIFGFALVVTFTRILSPAEYGIYVVGIGFSALISFVLFSWIIVSLLRFSSEGDDVDMRFTALVAFVVVAVLGPIAFGAVFALSEGAQDYLVPALCVAIGVGLFEFTLEIFRARQRTGLYAVSMICRSALAFCISCLLVLLFDLGGQGLLFGVAGGYAVTILIFMPKIWNRPVHKFDPEILRTMLKFGLPMTLSGAAFTLHAFVDRLVIVNFLGEASAGVYGASADFVRQVIQMLGVAVGSAIVPVAIRLYAQEDRQATNEHLIKSFEILLALILPAAVGMALTADRLAALVLGEAFREAASILIPVLVFALMFRSISFQYIHVSFQIAKKPFLMGFQGLFILIANVIGMIVLVPLFGLMGAAFSVVIAEICGVIFGFVVSRRAYPMPLKVLPVVKVCSATAFMAILVILSLRALNLDGITGIAVPVLTGVIAYSVAAFAVNIADIRTVLSQRLLGPRSENA